MHLICKALVFSTFALTLTAGPLFGQGYNNGQDHNNRNDGQNYNNNRNDDHRNDHHDNHQYVRHQDWRRGHRMDRNDWNRGERIDYRQYRLRAPRRGYEWREVDGNYVMAAVATGLIATVIAASAAR
ncbi:MAG: RcnB family protein [Granulicella sp.]